MSPIDVYFENLVRAMSALPLPQVRLPTYIEIAASKDLSQRHSLDDITRFLRGMLHDNVFPNVVILNQLINKLGHLGRVDYALWLYELASEKKIADKVTYATTIRAISRSPRPNVWLALDILNEAIRLEMIDAYTYNTMLTLIGHCAPPDVSLAVKILEAAYNSGLADTYTFNCALAVIRKRGDKSADRAVSMLHDARLAHLADADTYTRVIDMIALVDKKNVPVVYLISGKPIEKWTLAKRHHASQRDAHYFAYGALYFGLKRHILPQPSQAPITTYMSLIYGKFRGMPYACDAAMREVISHLSHQMTHVGVSFIQPDVLMGRLNIIINPSYPLHKSRVQFVRLMEQMHHFHVISHMNAILSVDDRQLAALDSLDKIIDFLTTMLVMNTFPSTASMNQLIKIMSALGYVHEAFDLLLLANLNQLLDTMTYNNLIAGIACSKNPDVDVAFYVFQQAKRHKLADHLTHQLTRDLLIQRRHQSDKQRIDELTQHMNQSPQMRAQPLILGSQCFFKPQQYSTGEDAQSNPYDLR